ncbi:MAG TPA: YbgA family protein, partial [Nitrospira sp.]|nr:YbgA family protein [Nitrospira sp.]
EGRLRDPVLRENFIERVFAYRRYQDLLRDDRTKPALVRFHTIHKFLLLSHSRPHYEALGRLVGEAHRYRPKELAETYGALFMSALAVKATVRKHVNVLNHIVGFFRSKLTAQEKRELLGVIEDFRHGLTPLIVPVTLVKHYVMRFGITYVQDQVYLHPHPKELMLRNHV